MICGVMLVSELGVPRRLKAVPISVASEQYWMFCGDVYLICEPLSAVLLRPPYERYREQLDLGSWVYAHTVRFFALS